MHYDDYMYIKEKLYHLISILICILVAAGLFYYVTNKQIEKNDQKCLESCENVCKSYCSKEK